MWTDQERALDQLRKNYGKSAFSEDHINFRRVGFKRREKVIQVIAETWDEAIDALAEKARKRDTNICLQVRHAPEKLLLSVSSALDGGNPCRNPRSALLSQWDATAGHSGPRAVNGIGSR